jgi:hypothetical protein
LPRSAWHFPALGHRRLAALTVTEVRAFSPEGVVVHAFRHGGQLVAENNRSLAALSLAGLRPVNIKIKNVSDEVRGQVRGRLDAISVLGDILPSRRMAVTLSQTDHRVGDIINLSGG